MLYLQLYYLSLFQPKLGITQESGSVTNGIFHCSFSRKNFIEGEKDVFDLNKDWFMMFAEGPAVNGRYTQRVTFI